MPNVKELEEMILEHKALIGFVMSKYYHLNPFDKKNEDVFSAGMVGLIKAIQTFDSKRNIKFSSYGCRCIFNEMGMYHRKQNKHINVLSTQDAIASDGEGEEVTIQDIIRDETIEDKEDKIVRDQEIVQVFKVILNSLLPKEKIVILFRLAELTQEQISDIMGFARSYISRIEKNAKSEIKKELFKKQEREEKIQVDTEFGCYRIHIPFDQFPDFESIFYKTKIILKCDGLSYYKEVIIEREKIKIVIKRNQKGFLFLANLFLLQHFPNSI